jgi:hypothetical protein
MDELEDVKMTFRETTVTVTVSQPAFKVATNDQCVRVAEAEMVLHIMFSSWSLYRLVAFHSSTLFTIHVSST